MKKSALRFLILTGLVKAALCALFGRNTYVPIPKTWLEAREYCREHHTDLSSISNQQEDNELLNTRAYFWYQKAWIGLYKDDNDMWKWSGGKNASYFNWSELKNTSDRCVAQNVEGWHKMNCESNKFHFYCFRSSLVLVKENKTWEEAMEHCRQQHTDLVSLLSESAVIKTLQTSREAQTDHMWTGLRYLADNWLWVNGDNMEYQAWSRGKMPQCPAWSCHCGALSLEGQLWDSWDCADQFNFVCL